jgi:hypothetical protein
MITRDTEGQILEDVMQAHYQWAFTRNGFRLGLLFPNENHGKPMSLSLFVLGDDRVNIDHDPLLKAIMKRSHCSESGE